MKTPINIHITAVDRLYNDKIITSEEYKVIMERLITEKVNSQKGDE